MVGLDRVVLAIRLCSTYARYRIRSGAESSEQSTTGNDNGPVRSSAFQYAQQSHDDNNVEVNVSFVSKLLTTPIVYSSLMTMSSGQRLASPLLTKSQTGNIIFQVTSNDTTQSKSMDKSNHRLESVQIYSLLV